jgi:hypothetical protein
MPSHQFHNDIENNIREYQRSVICVGREDSPSFAYTIGNHVIGLPELLVIGTSQGGFLNDLLLKLIERDCAFACGERVSLGGKFPVKIIDADRPARDDYTIQAGCSDAPSEGFLTLKCTENCFAQFQRAKKVRATMTAIPCTNKERAELLQQAFSAAPQGVNAHGQQQQTRAR